MFDRHEMRMQDRMLRVFAVMALIVFAPQDSWQDAIRARDYERAAQLLHPIVGESDEYTLRAQDPMPARQLALMYALGQGVPRDPIGACALAMTARFPVENAAPKFAGDVAGFLANRAQAQTFIDQHCNGLTSKDQQLAAMSIGCFALGMPEDEFTIGNQVVRVGRRGIGLVGAREDDLAALVQCPLVVSRIRTTVVQPPPKAAAGIRVRHVIELFTLTVGRNPATKARVVSLNWYAYEVSGSGVTLNMMTPLMMLPEWPRTPMLTDADGRVSLEMTRDGRVQWRLEGSELKGWLRDEESRQSDPAPH